MTNIPVRPHIRPRVAPVIKAAYKYSEAQELLGGISRTTLWRMIKSGEIKPLEGHNLIPASEIDKYFTQESKPRLRGRNKDDRKEAV